MERRQDTQTRPGKLPLEEQLRREEERRRRQEEEEQGAQEKPATPTGVRTK